MTLTPTRDYDVQHFRARDKNAGYDEATYIMHDVDAKEAVIQFPNGDRFGGDLARHLGVRLAERSGTLVTRIASVDSPLHDLDRNLAGPDTDGNGNGTGAGGIDA